MRLWTLFALFIGCKTHGIPALNPRTTGQNETAIKKSCLRAGGAPLNATGSVTIPGYDLNAKLDVADTKVKYLGNWTWNLGVHYHAWDSTDGQRYQMLESLWLDTAPYENLNNYKSTYSPLGCVFYANVWSKDQLIRAQSDDGTCSSFISTQCLRAIERNALEIPVGAMGFDGTYYDRCLTWSRLLRDRPPMECGTELAGNWLAPTAFQILGSDTHHDCSPAEAGFGNFSRLLPLATIVQDSVGGSFTNSTKLYDNTLLSPTMLITTLMYTNLVNGTGLNHLGDARVACVRPTKLTEGSLQPKNHLNSAASIAPAWISLSLTGWLVLALL